MVEEFRTCSLFKEPTEEEERERSGKTGGQHQPNGEPLCPGTPYRHGYVWNGRNLR